MNCSVCGARWPDPEGAERARCPQCQFDMHAPDARDAARIAAARRAFRDRSAAYAPERRVTTFDKAKPWLSVALGFVLFYCWLRACGRAF